MKRRNKKLSSPLSMILGKRYTILIKRLLIIKELLEV